VNVTGLRSGVPGGTVGGSMNRIFGFSGYFRSFPIVQVGAGVGSGGEMSGDWCGFEGDFRGSGGWMGGFGGMARKATV